MGVHTHILLVQSEFLNVKAGGSRALLKRSPISNVRPTLTIINIDFLTIFWSDIKVRSNFK
jgi:hypothetical protein